MSDTTPGDVQPMSVSEYQRSIVRVFTPQHSTLVGTGFCVDGTHVVTCAHVVALALGHKNKCPETQTAYVSVDFPYGGSDDKGPYRARVKACKIFRNDAQRGEVGDVAYLNCAMRTYRNSEPAHLSPRAQSPLDIMSAKLSAMVQATAIMVHWHKVKFNISFQASGINFSGSRLKAAHALKGDLVILSSVNFLQITKNVRSRCQLSGLLCLVLEPIITIRHGH
ncbi:MAG: hypothetical protein ACXV5H_07110 [Halobacteriota archaeon]